MGWSYFVLLLEILAQGSEKATLDRSVWKFMISSKDTERNQIFFDTHVALVLENLGINFFECVRIFHSTACQGRIMCTFGLWHEVNSF